MAAMKLNLQRETLLTPLQMVIGVVERKQTLPILSNVLLDTSDNKISITGTDLEVELVGQMALEAPSSTDGKLTVPGRKLMDICKALPENSAVELYQDKEQVILRSGRSRFTLSTLPAADFPNVENQASDINFEVKQSELRRLIQRCHFSMAQQDVRYYLNGMLLVVSSDYIQGVATDGHRLAASRLNIGTGANEKVQVIIPRKGIIELLRLLGNDDEPVQVELSGNHIRVSNNSYTFTSKLIEGRFPDFDRVIPKKADKAITLEKDYFKNALNRVAILCNEKFRGLRFEFRHHLLRILANNPEQEAAEEEIKVDYDSDELDIGFNVSYLIDIINSLDGDTVTLNFSDANSSLMIEEGDDNANFTYVVMPMRL
jgi:DNA polymerase-3 subunit beta